MAASGLLVLGDKGYLGGECIRTPYKGRNKPAAQKDANRAHARLRGPGERANAQLKSWRILRKSVAIAGSMTLTIYSAHAVILNTPLQNDNPYALDGGLVAGALTFAVVWHRFVMTQGPLEWMVAKGSGSARSAAMSRLTRTQGEPRPRLAFRTR